MPNAVFRKTRGRVALRAAVGAVVLSACALAVLLLTMSGSLQAEGQADVVKDPSGANLFLGAGPLTIQERVQGLPGGNGLGSYTLQVAYDPNAVTIVLSDASFLGSLGRAVSCAKTFGTGSVKLSCSSTGLAPGPSGKGVLANITVRPADKLRIRAAQDNGIKVFLDDVFKSTRLFDTKGNVIGVSSVGDASIAVRALEGDVNTDCVVDKKDETLVRQRLGARVGTLSYSVFLDLQPALAPDGDIDVNDVQVVAGRIGSTCTSPNPAQPPPPKNSTPTAKPTSTVTPTPNKPVRVQKLPAFQNLWLTRQGPKIPPVQCAGPQGGSNTATFAEQISATNESALPELGGFEFTVNYDAKIVCIELQRGPAADQDMICIIEDSLTRPELQGVAHMRCMALSKNVTGPATGTKEGRILAFIVVRPQPDVYSQLKPNQDNGVVTQLIDKGCKLVDLQQRPIPIFSCENADVTIRYLEGDVQPDCQVDILDTQIMAFHLDAQKGSLTYSAWFDLEPSNTQKDGDIDINDLQFVAGRLGSTCEQANPPQPPRNAKP